MSVLISAADGTIGEGGIATLSSTIILMLIGKMDSPFGIL